MDTSHWCLPAPFLMSAKPRPLNGINPSLKDVSLSPIKTIESVKLTSARQQVSMGSECHPIRLIHLESMRALTVLPANSLDNEHFGIHS